MNAKQKYYLVEIAATLAQGKGLRSYSKRFSTQSNIPPEIQLELALGFLRQIARKAVEERLLLRHPKLREESHLYWLRDDLEKLLDVVFELDDWELCWLNSEERESRITISGFQLRDDKEGEKLPIEGSLNGYLIHHWKFRRPVNALLRRRDPNISLEHDLGEGFKVKDVLADPKSIIREDELYFHFLSHKCGFVYQLREIIRREEDLFLLDCFPQNHPEFNIKSVLLFILDSIISFQENNSVGNCKVTRPADNTRLDQHSLWLINYMELFRAYEPDGPTYEQIKHWMPKYFKPRAKVYLERFLDN